MERFGESRVERVNAGCVVGRNRNDFRCRAVGERLGSFWCRYVVRCVLPWRSAGEGQRDSTRGSFEGDRFGDRKRGSRSGYGNRRRRRSHSWERIQKRPRRSVGSRGKVFRKYRLDAVDLPVRIRIEHRSGQKSGNGFVYGELRNGRKGVARAVFERSGRRIREPRSGRRVSVGGELQNEGLRVSRAAARCVGSAYSREGEIRGAESGTIDRFGHGYEQPVDFAGRGAIHGFHGGNLRLEGVYGNRGADDSGGDVAEFVLRGYSEIYVRVQHGHHPIERPRIRVRRGDNVPNAGAGSVFYGNSRGRVDAGNGVGDFRRIPKEGFRIGPLPELVGGGVRPDVRSYRWAGRILGDGGTGGELVIDPICFVCSKYIQKIGGAVSVSRGNRKAGERPVSVAVGRRSEKEAFG